jgi:hypothetical protein
MQQRACVSFTLVRVCCHSESRRSVPIDAESAWRDEGIQTLKRNLSLPVILSAQSNYIETRSGCNRDEVIRLTIVIGKKPHELFVIAQQHIRAFVCHSPLRVCCHSEFRPAVLVDAESSQAG